MNRRFVIAVTCVPMPPNFLALPLRQIILPFIGRLPVISQILDINQSPIQRVEYASRSLCKDKLDSLILLFRRCKRISILPPLFCLMAKIKPFAALRPDPQLAGRVCELPYDVMSTQEA